MYALCMSKAYITHNKVENRRSSWKFQHHWFLGNLSFSKEIILTILFISTYSYRLFRCKIVYFIPTSCYYGNKPGAKLLIPVFVLVMLMNNSHTEPMCNYLIQLALPYFLSSVDICDSVEPKKVKYL